MVWLLPASFLVLALTTASVPPMAEARAVAAPSHALATGISYVTEDEPLAFQHVRAAGARFVQTWIPWETVAPVKQPAYWDPANPADPNYRWGSLDQRISEATEAGLTPVLQIASAPIWAQACPPTSILSFSVCDPSPVMLADFATAAARRYSGYFEGLPRVRYWQGLNEPNLSLFFNPQFEGGKPVSPTLYRKLINAFYFAVKSVSPSNLVLAAGLGPIARPGSTIGPMRFARELLCMRGRQNPRPAPDNCNGGVHFDIFDIHPYTTGGPTHEGHIDDVELGDLGKLQALLRAADKAGRIRGKFRRTPLWITELSWDSKPPDPGGLPMRILSRWTAEALYQAWSAGVSHFFWYSLRDSAPIPGVPFSETLESGLYFRGATVAEDQPKPNMYVFRFPFVAYSEKDGFSFWGRTPNSKGGPVLIQIRQGGRWRNAGVARADRHGIFEGEVQGFYGRNKRGAVRARYRKELAVPFSLKPVRDFWQPPFGKPVG